MGFSAALMYVYVIGGWLESHFEWSLGCVRMYWLSIFQRCCQRFWNCKSHLNLLDVVVHEVFGEYEWYSEKLNPDSVSLHSFINHVILVLNKRNVIFLYRSSPFSYHLWGLWRFSSYSSSKFCNNLQVKIILFHWSCFLDFTFINNKNQYLFLVNTWMSFHWCWCLA